MRISGRRPLTTAAAAALTALMAGAPAVPATADIEPADETSSRWTLATLPDTQFYSRYAADQFQPRYGSNPYQVQAEWLAEVHEDLNIPLVAHLGDLVDRASVEREWVAADAAHRALEGAGLPYSVLPGNHDLTNTRVPDRELGANEPYLRWFGPQRALAQSTDAGRDESGFSEYHVFEAEGQEYLMLALAWRVSDETLAWAEDVMAEHPTLPTILTSHEILGVDSDGVTAVTGANGERLWQELIRSNDQIFLTISGHNHGSAYRTLENDNGNEVIQVLQDWQMNYEGGNGFLGLFEFDLANDAIHVSAPSPWVVWKPQEALTVYDQPFLDAPNEEFTLEVDFTERFSGFNPDWEPGDGQYPSLTQRARDIILDGFEGVPAVSRDLPGSVEDYPRVDGTVAHWRPNLVDAEIGDVLPEGSVLPDVVLAEQAMTRGPVATSPTAREEDVTLCQGHAFSASSSGICFANSSRPANRFSYFSTETGVPVNNVDLSDGYTIEAFINISEEWNATDNAWTRALARTGNRSRLEGMPRITDYTASPASIGFSNLREFQWTVVPEDPRTGDRTAWSGEITSDDWYHLAIVNTPEDGAVTMYVDGMPILRNITDGNGMAFEEDFPWMIGAALSNDLIGSGWHGGVGEVRIIDRATEPGDWLIDRPDVSRFEPATTRIEITEGEPLPALTGTGHPGATIRAEGSVSGEAVVGEDGTWTLEGILDLDDAAAGTYEADLTQGFGERRSAAVALTVVVDEAPTTLPATVLAETRCTAGRVTLVARVTNDSASTVDVNVETAYGTHTVTDVEPGRSVLRAFSTRLPAIEAGIAHVSVNGVIDGEGLTSSFTAEYADKGCSR
ncbi:metallophosphoesterase [Georgenia sp. MJ206]|uniref:LamG-like jellyroll fold domain-containing protein n=1 Tax=Georgenia wangjunii TaxID=3117730 RepID=UPI002F26D6E1